MVERDFKMVENDGENHPIRKSNFGNGRGGMQVKFEECRCKHSLKNDVPQVQLPIMWKAKHKMACIGLI